MVDAVHVLKRRAASRVAARVLFCDVVGCPKRFPYMGCRGADDRRGVGVTDDACAYQCVYVRSMCDYG